MTTGRINQVATVRQAEACGASSRGGPELQRFLNQMGPRAPPAGAGPGGFARPGQPIPAAAFPRARSAEAGGAWGPQASAYPPQGGAPGCPSHGEPRLETCRRAPECIRQTMANNQMPTDDLPQCPSQGDSLGGDFGHPTHSRPERCPWGQQASRPERWDDADEEPQHASVEEAVAVRWGASNGGSSSNWLVNGLTNTR